MPSISPLIVHLFDDPHGKHRVKRSGDDAKRDRFASKARVPRRWSKHVD
jgi:hypothetical protein